MNFFNVEKCIIGIYNADTKNFYKNKVDSLYKTKVIVLQIGQQLDMFFGTHNKDTCSSSVKILINKPACINQNFKYFVLKIACAF